MARIEAFASPHARRGAVSRARHRSARPRSGPGGALRRRLFSGLAFVLALALPFGGGVHADEAPGHLLGGSTLCLDPGAVVVELEGLSPRRTRVAGRLLSRRFEARLLQALERGGVDHVRGEACGDGDAFVTLFVRVAALDEGVYAPYGPRAFGCVLLLQVGERPEAPRPAAHRRLPGQRYEAFDELVYSEAGRSAARFERFLPGRGAVLFHALVEAWRADNP